MDVLTRRFEVDGSALSWMAEFLNNRRQVVHAGKSESDNKLNYRRPASIIYAEYVLSV